MSSLTNFAVTIYVARTLGAAELGAFSLAAVTYAFAISVSRGLTTDPLMVRYSGADYRAWRHGVASCTGTAMTVGVAIGGCALAAGALLGGTARGAFLALGLTLPGLLLQDSWRFAFFALGRGSKAFLNDLIWGAVLVPALMLLRVTGHVNIFWCVLAWGVAAAVAAAVGPWQAGVIPRPSKARGWVLQHRDLGPRYLAENTSGGVATQLRAYGVGLILGLSTLGYVQAALTLMGPVMVLFLGMSLVTIPEAVRVLQRSPRHLPLFCLLVSVGLAAAGLAWGVVLMVALPRGLGALLLGSVWKPTYPLVPWQTLAAVGLGAAAGAVAGLHALGAARRSVRAALPASTLFVVCSLVGALLGGVVGAMIGTAVSTWMGALLEWWQLRGALRKPQIRDRYRGRHVANRYAGRVGHRFRPRRWA